MPSLGLAAAVLLWGCSPFSRKSEPKELFPADSLSRDIAAQVEPETLVLDWRFEAGEHSYFSSLLMGPDTTVWVSDLANNSIRRFALDGAEMPAKTGFRYPYLSGHRHGRVDVFDAGTNRLVSADTPDEGMDLPGVEGESAALSRQVTVVDDTPYLKDARPPQAVLYRLGSSGIPELTIRLPGPVWHHYGVLRPWRGTLVSASSYRPVIVTIDGAEIDSLHLDGFDSPMLARVRAYTLGSVDEPPLIISGVYGGENDLYVLNLRPGVIRIDVFDANVRLKRILQFEAPEPTGFTPVDLVIEADADSSRAFVASVNTVYGSLSLQYASRLDRFSFATRETD